MHADAPSCERQCDPAGTDTELERGTIARQMSEQVDSRIDDSRFEHVRHRLVIPLGHTLAEIILSPRSTA